MSWKTNSFFKVTSIIKFSISKRNDIEINGNLRIVNKKLKLVKNKLKNHKEMQH